MTEFTNKSSLSAPRRRLVELMQQINFGRIENLHFRAGEPVFDPAPRVVHTIKVGADNGPRPEAWAEDFRLKHQILELFGLVPQCGDALVLCIDVKHGLPFTVEVEVDDFGANSSQTPREAVGV